MTIVFIDSTSTGLRALQTAQKMGYRVAFIHQKSPSFASLAISNETDLRSRYSFDGVYRSVESLDDIDLMPILDELCKDEELGAILTSSEAAILPTARAAERYGTCYASYKALQNAVFKDRCRAKLQHHPIYGPAFETVIDLEQYPTNGAIKPPFVVKPVRGFGKQYSTICRDWPDFKAFSTTVQEKRRGDTLPVGRLISDKYLIESYVTGTLHSAEVIVRQGKVEVFASTDRYRASHYELLEVAAAMPSALNRTKIAAATDYLQKVFNALGIDVGLYHVEFLITVNGPMLIEINARMMGSISPLMYETLTGIDPYEILIRTHLDLPFDTAESIFSDAALTLAIGAQDSRRISENLDIANIDHLLDAFGIKINSLKINPGSTVQRYEGNLSILGHVILHASDTPAVAQKGLDFLRELDVLLGIKTAKYEFIY